MLDIIHLTNIILPFLYFATFFVYYLDFIKDKPELKNYKRLFLFVTLIVHLLYLGMRTVEFNHPPITNKFEIFTLLSFSLAFSYFLLELSTDIRSTGLFIMVLSFIFQIISSIFIEDLTNVKEVLQNRMLGMHVISALLGYSGITISAVYAFLFVVQYKRIKMNKFGLFFERLPSLELLEKLTVVSVIIGFILLSIAIIIGGIWLPSAFPDFSYLDPKLLGTFAVWVIYFSGLLYKWIKGFYGKKFMIFSLVGFVAAILSLVVSSIITNSFHNFY